MIDRIERMVEAAHSTPPVMMEVFHRYDYRGDGVLLVVEGKDDSAFYERVARERSADPNREFDTVVAGNKEAVIGVFDKVDWSSFDRNRLLFCVDRDYSDFVESVPRISGDNVYVTDGYSIENSLLDQNTAIKLAGRSCASNTLLTLEDRRVVVECYEESKVGASHILIPMAACQVLCLKRGQKFEAKSFSIERYLVAEKGKVGPRGCTDATEAIDAFLGSVPDIEVDKSEIDATVKVIAQHGSYENSVRGKYRLQVFRMWLLSLKDVVLPSGATIKPGVVLNDLLTNAMAVAAAPQSLKEFFDRNLD